MNGFEMPEQMDEINFSFIFMTGDDQYAKIEIRFSALDYLMKPIDPKELIAAVRNVEMQQQHPKEEQFAWLMERIKQPERVTTKIA